MAAMAKYCKFKKKTFTTSIGRDFLYRNLFCYHLWFYDITFDSVISLQQP